MLPVSPTPSGPQSGLTNSFIPDANENAPYTKKIRVMSFDVGIKNLAYCTIDVSENGVSILDWRVIDMTLEESANQDGSAVGNAKCNSVLVSKIKKKKKGGIEGGIGDGNSESAGSVCGRKAVYKKGDKCFCNSHAGKNTLGLILPKKPLQPASLKKLKMDALLSVCYEHSVFPRLSQGDSVPLKRDILKRLDEYLQARVLEPVVKKAVLSANDVTLISIGRAMKRILDSVPDLDKVTHVIIENQISPIAARMKTVQGMLTQYFIMRYESAAIEYISSINKLKIFPQRAGGDTEPGKGAYRQHKTDGIYHASLVLDENPRLGDWGHIFGERKRDDYCDSFLQGVWFLANRRYISMQSGYKISRPAVVG
jgi:hypothetical protein